MICRKRQEKRMCHSSRIQKPTLLNQYTKKPKTGIETKVLSAHPRPYKQKPNIPYTPTSPRADAARDAIRSSPLWSCF